MKNKPQYTVTIEVTKDKFSMVFRVTVWNGALFALSKMKTISSKKTVSACVITPKDTRKT